jgi:hypothetical protein
VSVGRLGLTLGLVASAVVVAWIAPSPATADGGCNTGATTSSGQVLSNSTCLDTDDSGRTTKLSGGTGDPDVLAVDYVPSCQAYDINTANGITCTVKIPGCDPNETKFDVRVKYAEGSDEYPTGGWLTTDVICVGPGGPPADPTVGPDEVLQALHRTGLPDAELQTQPGFKSGKTLVNFDTNFYTNVAPVHDTFTLLGQDVEVEATPTSYTWHFDSGQSDQTRTTTTPGAPYPDLDVTYAYDDAHVTVHPSVDVTYSARFSVNGGPWQTIPATVTLEGDPINRYVAEATAVLADMQ